MEDPDVGEELSADYRVIEARLTALEKMLDELDKQFVPLRAIKGRQGPGMWGGVPACQQFASTYTRTLATLESNLLAMRDEVGVLRQALADSAATLKDVDARIEERLAALATRLDEGAPGSPLVCTPYDTLPTSDRGGATEPAPTPAPTPSPSPAPTPTAPGGGGW